MVRVEPGMNNELGILAQDLQRKLEATIDPAAREILERAIAVLEPGRAHQTSGISPQLLAKFFGNKALVVGGEPPLTDNAKVVLQHRYFLKDNNGNIVEDAKGMFSRVAKAISEIDKLYDPNANTGESEAKFYNSMAKLEFLPNSPTMMNAGTGAGTLSACFVLPLQDSMEEIMKTATDIAMVQKFGGGTGVSLSQLRPKGSPIATTHGRACGPIAVLSHLSSVSTMITQGGKRDGANMAVMDVHHPDLMEFINAKHQEGVVHNYNISVGVDDEFLQAVESGGDLILRDPQGGQEVSRVSAVEVFNQIVAGAWRNGEPGMIFLDQVNRDNPTPNIGPITATNPCGEQPLLPYESCNLGSINLARMIRVSSEEIEIDWDLMKDTVHLAVHFLDNVIDANRYSVSEIEQMTKMTRKIGLGVMGFADMLIRLGIPYDSEDGIATGRQVMAFICKESDEASSALASVRGAFPAFEGSRHDYPGAPKLRNACRLTVAPTGTISMIAGCSSGIEPLFALAFRKQNILEGQTLYYIDEAFETVSREEGFLSEGLTDSLSQGNSLKQREDVPLWVKELFVTAPDIAPEWHVRMQAAFQEYTDAAISKTINFPNEATEEDVRKAYLLAWKLGCKGITVYRAGSREKEVLTAGTDVSANDEREVQASQSVLRPRQRPQRVRGVTERLRTGNGTIFVTINSDEEGKPFEVFTALGKAGSSDSAQLEAVARLVSMALRAGVDPEEIVSQLRGITDEPVWDSGVLVRSAPDALALALGRAIGGDYANPVGEQLALIQKEDIQGGKSELITGIQNGNGRSGWGSCPDCSGPLVYQEGCLMCRECGYNRCG